MVNAPEDFAQKHTVLEGFSRMANKHPEVRDWGLLRKIAEALFACHQCTVGVIDPSMRKFSEQSVEKLLKNGLLLHTADNDRDSGMNSINK